MRVFNKNFVTVGIIILILVSAPFHFVHAGLIDAVSETVIFFTVGWMFALVKAILVGFIALMGNGIDAILGMPIQSSGVVQNAWNLVRQFANMFFIVILVVMAFYTIFDLGGYDFKTLIGRFIIAALLINFSLAICGYIIEITQSISDVFLNAIGSVGNRLAQEAQLGNRFDPSAVTAVVTVDTSTWQKIIAAFADIILLGIMFFSMAVLFVMTFIRIPILWALMIFSPLAWITYILPSTRDINRKWWNNFIGWNAFFPIYLFFIYIGVYLLTNRTAILSGQNTVKFLGISFEDLFFYILIAMVLIGGAKMAMSASMAAGAGGVAMGVWARGRTAARFSGGILVRPVTSRYDAAKGATQERIAQVKREGVFGFGGTENQERRQAAYADRFGVRDAKEKQLAKDVSTRKERLKTTTDPKVLEELSTKGTDYERLAALERLAEMQQLRAEQVVKAFELYGGAGSLNARKFIDRVDPNKYTKGERDELYDQVNDVKFKQKIALVRAERGDFTDIKEFSTQSTIFTSEADKAEFARKAKDYIERLKSADRQAIYASVEGEMKKELALVLAEKGDFGGDFKDPVTGEITTSVARIKEAALLFEAPNQQENLINKAKPKNIVAAIQAKRDLGLLPEDKTYETVLEEEVGRLSNKDILNLSTQSLKNEEFQNALVKSLSRGAQSGKRINGLLSNLEATAEKIEALSPAINRIRAGASATGATTEETTESDEDEEGGMPNERSRNSQQPPKSRIILTPGAQFEIEKEERNKQP